MSITQWSLALLVGLLVLIAAYVALGRYAAANFFSRQPKALRGAAKWRDLGPTPLGNKRYTPQGMCWRAGKLIFANSWKNTKSRVYRIDPVSHLSGCLPSCR